MVTYWQPSALSPPPRRCWWSAQPGLAAQPGWAAADTKVMKRLFSSCALSLVAGTCVGGALLSAPAAQALGVVHPNGAPRATGYVGRWTFDGNDGTPQLTVPVS